MIMKGTNPTLDHHFQRNPVPLSQYGVTAWGIYRASRNALVMRTTVYLLPAPNSQAGFLVIDRGLN